MSAHTDLFYLLNAANDK